MDIESSYATLLDVANNDIYIKTAMTVCLQTIESGTQNIIVVVAYNSDVAKVSKIIDDIALELEYTIDWVSRCKLRLVGGAQYIMIEAVLDRYIGSDFISVPLLNNETLVR